MTDVMSVLICFPVTLINTVIKRKKEKKEGEEEEAERRRRRFISSYSL